MLSTEQVDDLRKIEEAPKCKECGAEVVWVQNVVEKRPVKKGHQLEWDGECDKYYDDSRFECSKDSSHGTGWGLFMTEDYEVVVAEYPLLEGGDTDGGRRVRDDEGSSNGDGADGG